MSPESESVGIPASYPQEGTLRVWWIPQIPGTPFETIVPDMAAGRLLCDTLARYDLFQYEQRIKPDYANVGGVSVFHDGEWEDLDPDDADDMAYYTEELACG